MKIRALTALAASVSFLITGLTIPAQADARTTLSFVTVDGKPLEPGAKVTGTLTDLAGETEISYTQGESLTEATDISGIAPNGKFLFAGTIVTGSDQWEVNATGQTEINTDVRLRNVVNLDVTVKNLKSTAFSLLHIYSETGAFWYMADSVKNFNRYTVRPDSYSVLFNGTLGENFDALYTVADGPHGRVDEALALDAKKNSVATTLSAVRADAKVTLNISDAQGKALPAGGKILLQRSSGESVIRTLRKGKTNYTVKGLSAGQWSVYVYDKNDLPAVQTLGKAHVNVRVGKETQFTGTFKTLKAKSTGKVYFDARDYNPNDVPVVSFLNKAGEVVYSATEYGGLKGEKVTLPTGTYTVRFSNTTERQTIKVKKGKTTAVRPKTVGLKPTLRITVPEAKPEDANWYESVQVLTPKGRVVASGVVTGATVTIYGNLKPGKYTVKLVNPLDVSKLWRKSFPSLGKTTLTVKKKSGVTKVKIKRAKPTTVTGAVVNKAGKPVPGIIVTAEVKGVAAGLAITETDGSYWIPGFPRGTEVRLRFLDANAVGYWPTTTKITTKKASRTRVPQVVLKAVPQ